MEGRSSFGVAENYRPSRRGRLAKVQIAKIPSLLRWAAGESGAGRWQPISQGTIHQEQEIPMNLNHETAQEFDVDALLALAEADEALSVEAVTPNRLNSKYALLQEPGNG
jgi:hypothetical protein